MPKSMTGFARQELQKDWGKLSCEIRSVNHRYLEPHFRIAESCKPVEMALRDMLKKHCSRGKIEFALSVKMEESGAGTVALDKQAASELIDLAGQLRELGSHAEPMRAIDILKWPGVLKTLTIDGEEIEKAALEVSEQTLQQLVAHRQREGQELAGFIEARLVMIEEHLSVLNTAAPEIQQQLDARLREKIAALETDVDENRLAQEIVFLSNKADVTEELDRLKTHVQEARLTLKKKEPIGRRLDFLMQEFNREANTLSSKAARTDITQIAIDLKVMIEQMREQVQNME